MTTNVCDRTIIRLNTKESGAPRRRSAMGTSGILLDRLAHRLSESAGHGIRTSGCLLCGPARNGTAAEEAWEARHFTLRRATSMSRPTLPSSSRPRSKTSITRGCNGRIERGLTAIDRKIHRSNSSSNASTAFVQHGSRFVSVWRFVRVVPALTHNVFSSCIASNGLCELVAACEAKMGDVGREEHAPSPFDKDANFAPDGRHL